MTIVVALFAGALTFGAALVVLTTHRRVALHRQLGHYVGPSTTGRRSRRLADGRFAELMDAALVRLGIRERFAIALDRAGIDSSPGGVAALIALAAAASFVLALVAVGAAKAILVAVALPFIARLALSVIAARRARAFELQLPEILDNLSASLRAGHGFDHALQHLASDIGEPAGREFRRVVAEVHLGRTLEVALADLGRRVRSKDLDFVLDAITVQRQVGGSLADLFALVAATVRQREQFRRKLKAITGLPRASAKILAALPVGTALLLAAINPHYMAPLLNTAAGRIMLVITALMVVTGGYILRRIGTVTV
ncbi:MAG TPA: type II secretion system F family protein [Gaiellaceae bacterium]|nr:type II secretion system F family protein [Gaiellaceae bacterium]